MTDIQLFSPGKAFNDAYKNSRGKTLAGLAFNTQGDERQGHLAELAKYNPVAAQSMKKELDESDKQGFIDGAKLLNSFRNNPEMANQAYQRLKPKLSALGVQMPDQLDPTVWQAVDQINAAYDTQQGAPTDVRSLQWKLEQAGYKQGSTEYKNAMDVELGLRGRQSSAGISYKVIKGSDGKERLVAVDPRTPGAIVMDGSSGFGDYTQEPKTPEPPKDPRFNDDYVGRKLQALDASGQQLLALGWTNEAVASFKDAEFAKIAKETGMTSADSAPPTQPTRVGGANQGMFTSRTPEETAGLEANAKNQSELDYAGRIAQAKADVEFANAPRTAGATETAKIEAEANAKRKASAPDAISKARFTIGLLDKAINHPGRKAATGGTAIMPWEMYAGSPAKDFITLHKQLEGRAFLEAFESLKGGGQITQIEGEKATQAMARLERAQSEGEFLAALEELKEIAQKGIERAEAALGKQSATGGKGKYSVGQTINVGGKRYKVTGGDMNDPDLEELK